MHNFKLHTYIANAIEDATRLSKLGWDETAPDYAGKKEGTKPEYNVAAVSVRDKDAIIVSEL